MPRNHIYTEKRLFRSKNCSFERHFVSNATVTWARKRNGILYKDLILNSAISTRSKKLQPENVRTTALKLGLSEEKIIFSYMRETPEVCGAMQDWDDIPNICIAVIRELKAFFTFQQAHDRVLHVIKLYVTQVITVLRAFSDVKRLAFFVNEMIETLLEVPAYSAMIDQQVFAFTNGDRDRIVARGFVLRRITSTEVRALLMKDKGKFFKAEIMRSESFGNTQHNNAGGSN